MHRASLLTLLVSAITVASAHAADTPAAGTPAAPAAAPNASAAADAPAAEWINLFNGHDLSNWINVNCAPETWTVADGVIKCTGHPTGALRTPRMYENFILEAEWRHLQSGGNAGIFIWGSPLAAPGVPFLRAIEVQVLDTGYGNTESHTTHGDVFPIHGSTMAPFGKHNGMRAFPSEWRSKPAPEWNHYRVECRDGTIRLSVNGQEVTRGENCVWRKGYLGLESEGAPVEWRLVRIQELPPGPTPATAEQTAPEAKGHHQLYNGVDLRGWKSETLDHWQPADWKLVPKSGEPGKPLWTEAEFGDYELVIDCKVGKDAKDKHPTVLPFGTIDAPAELSSPTPGKWTRYTITVKGDSYTIKSTAEGNETASLATRSGSSPIPKRRHLGLLDNGGDVEFGNIYVREL